MPRPIVAAARAALLAALLAGPALAEDRAVVIVERDYVGAPQAVAPDYNALVATTRTSGLRSASGVNLSARDLPLPLALFEGADGAPGLRLAVLTGRFVSGGDDVWLLGTDASAPGLSMADRQGISVGHIAALMRDGSRQGIVLLGESPGQIAPGPRLAQGIGPLRDTPGLSVVAGPPIAIARAAATIAQKRGAIVETVRADPQLRVVAAGDSAMAALRDARARSAPQPTAIIAPSAQRPAPSTPVASPAPAPATPAATPSGPIVLSRPALVGEPAAWVEAAAVGSIPAYTGFLQRFPEGRYAEVARARLAALGVPTPAAAPAPSPAPNPAPAPASAAPTPADPRDYGPVSPALAEIALMLSFGERAQIQRILTEAGYDTRGADGTFGPGTREAIRAWQGAAGRAVTGYLDAAGLQALRALDRRR